MNFASIARQHLAAIRALAVLTVITGLLYPVLVWGLAQLPGLRESANGSVVHVDGKVVGSALIGQLYADADGNPLPQYFQGRPSAAGDGYDPMATSASNLGPEDIVDTADKTSLLTQVCTRSLEVAQANGVDGARPFCTDDGVGAVLSVIGPRDATGHVTAPTDVVSVNQPCGTATPFLDSYAGVRVRCAEPDADYAVGQIVGVRGSAPDAPVVPVDAVTASASGLDPDISPAYAALQVDRVAQARGLDPQQVREVVRAHTSGRTLGFAGEPRVNVLLVNIALDELSMGG